MCGRNVEVLKNEQPLWQEKLAVIYREEAFAGSNDPEQQLYDGFIGDRDRRLCEQVRGAQPDALANDKNGRSMMRDCQSYCFVIGRVISCQPVNR